MTSSPGTRIFRILTLTALAMACMLSLLPATGHDQMWFLYAADRVLHGTQLYGPRLVESNPPLMFWLLFPVEITARLLHVAAVPVFKLYVIAAEALVALWCARILRASPGSQLMARPWVLAFAFLCVFAVMPARDFGQREHLLALFLLPYLLQVSAAAEAFPSPSPFPLPQQVAAGVLAGVGVALKPHHLLVPAAIELVWFARFLRTGNRASSPIRSLLVPPGLLALVATCAVYLAAILRFTPAYVSTIVPILRATYWAIGPLTLPELARQAIELDVLALVTIVGFFAGFFVARPRQTCLWPVLILSVAGVASTAAYALQGTGWYYQQIPALSFFGLALWLQLMDWADRRHIQMPSTPAVAALSVIALSLTAYFSGYSLAQPLHFPSGLSDTPDPDFFRDLPAGTPVTIITIEVDHSVPPIYIRHLVFAQRQNVLWSLPAILRNQTPIPSQPPRRTLPPAIVAELDRVQHQWMAEDLARWQPRLILVERCQDFTVHCQTLEDRHDNLLAWFLRDPAFRTQFAHYRYWRSSGPFDAWLRAD